jgi:type IV pilus assembly protein PilM
MKSVSARRVLALDFGAHAIKVGEFQWSADDRLTLLNYGIKAMDHHDSRDHFSCLVKTLKGLFEETRVHRMPVVVGVSEAFMRFVKLPPNLEDHSIRKIMEYEAKQNIPVPLEEVVWDYQLLSDGEEKEVAIVAVKKDFLEEIHAALAHFRAEIIRVEVTPWALAETYRFNYPDSRGCSLLMDIGDKTTHLVFVEKEKIFCRALPMAGHLITKNIAKEF